VAPIFLGKKWLFSLLLFFAFSSCLPLFLKAQSYKILPLGNSITKGKPEDPGYRYPLYEQLTDAYIDFTYVGSLSSPSMQGSSPGNCLENPRSIPELFHEGHGGWRSDEILNGKPASDPGKLADWLQAYTADVVLMHVGTNDMFQNRSVNHVLDRFREIVQLLRQDNPRVIILMATLIPADPATVGTTEAANIGRLNAAIPGLVQELTTTNSPVLLVDQQADFDPTPGADTFDGIHTNARGSKKMANKWFKVLQTVLYSYTQAPGVSITAPANGATAESGKPLSITASAQDPDGAVKKVEFYANCQKIGEATTAPYSISWTPTQTGTYTLLARVQDDAGATALSSPVSISIQEGGSQDEKTEAPVLHSPTANTYSKGPVALDFSLPEAAKAGSVTLTFTRTGGTADAHSPHVLTFGSAYEAAGRYSLSLSGTDLSSHQGVISVSSHPQDALQSGATYSLTISYQDAAGNAAASATTTGFHYDTSPPARPDKPSLAAGSDTGISATDGITANARPVLQGQAEAGSRVSIFKNGAPIASVAAGNTGSWSYAIPADKALAHGTYQISVTATDAAGNESAASAALQLVIDLQQPVVRTKELEVALDATGKASISPDEIDGGSSDGVSPRDKLQFSLSRNAFSCADAGKQLEVLLTVTDEAGNEASAPASLRVVDKRAPQLEVKAVALQLNEQGKATLSASEAVVSVSDNCNTTAISFSRTDFGCADAGKTFAVTVTATDASGNRTQKEISVTVSDASPPVAKAKNLTLQLNASGQASLSAAELDGGSSDNCALASLQLNKTNFSCDDLGTLTVQLTARDAAGNEATAQATITVTDLLPPVIPAGQEFRLDENSPAGSLVGRVQATDNCGISSWEITGGNTGQAFQLSADGSLSVKTSSALDYEVRKEFLLTLKARDKANNTTSAALTVFLNNLNDTAPVLSVPSELVGNELELIQFTASATDADGDTDFVFSLAGTVPAGAAIDAGSGLFSWTPAEDQDGVHSLVVRVSDGIQSSEKPVTIRVLEVNLPPRITSTPGLQVAAEEPYEYQLEAEDDDLPANTLQYSAPQLPAWLQLDAASGLLTGSPQVQHIGEHPIVVAVSDGTVTVEQAFTLQVTPPTGLEQTGKAGIRLYPNPSSGTIWLKIEDFPAGSAAQARLYSPGGRLILQLSGSPEQLSEGLSSYLKGAKAGMFMLQLVWQDVRSTHKIVRH
jgi:hypothetical protein